MIARTQLWTRGRVLVNRQLSPPCFAGRLRVYIDLATCLTARKQKETTFSQTQEVAHARDSLGTGRETAAPGSATTLGTVAYSAMPFWSSHIVRYDDPPVVGGRTKSVFYARPYPTLQVLRAHFRFGLLPFRMTISFARLRELDAHSHADRSVVLSLTS
jgi:hypothetical protein